MRVEFKSSFGKDLRQIKDLAVRQRIREAVGRVEQAAHLQQIGNLHKLYGEGPDYRLRVGDYRVGIRLEGDVLIFVRCLHRKDMYRYFP